MAKAAKAKTPEATGEDIAVIFKSTVQHDGETFGAGESAVLSAADATLLIAVGAAERAVADEPKADAPAA